MLDELSPSNGYKGNPNIVIDMETKNELEPRREQPLEGFKKDSETTKTSSVPSPFQMECSLTEDVYSLLAVSAGGSPSFFYCLVVMGVQLLIVVLVLMDLTDLNNSVNPLGIPPGVDLVVTVAQGIATAMAVTVETNLLVAFSKMTESTKIGPMLEANGINRHDGAWWVCKYRASILVQFIAGISTLLASYILNMQTETVLDLILNFAALAFIGEMQEIAFWIASQGYVCIQIQEDTERVSAFQVPVVQHHQHRALLYKRGAYVFISLVMLGSYAWMVHMQRSGTFLCQTLFVQFGDAFRPEMPSFTGEYTKDPSLRLNGRVVYVDSTTKQSGARLAYCEAEQAWTFSGGSFTLEFNKDSEIFRVEPDDDPCVDYWARSQPTSTYDITDTISAPWMVINPFTNQTLPLDYINLICLDCTDVKSGASNTRTCSHHGTCENNRCECNFGRFGLNCEHAMPCTNLELDQRTDTFPFVLQADLQGRYRPLSSYGLLVDAEGIPVEVYHKPVYVSRAAKFTRGDNTEMGGDEDILDVILFLGRRWGLALGNVDFWIQDLNETTRTSSSTVPTRRRDLVEYLRSEQFQAIYSGYHFNFMSDVVDAETPSDGVAPIELSWYQTRKWLTLAATESEESNGPLKAPLDLYRADLSQPIHSVLLCKHCQSTLNPCINGGVCENQDLTPHINDGKLDGGNGTCSCPLGFSGHLCEREQACTDDGVICLHNGTCNTHTGDCICPPFHEGRLCQYQRLEASPLPL